MMSKASFFFLNISFVLLLQYLSVLCVSQNFDFFYFVQEWPGSYCDTQKSCCYPTTGKPESDFGIHGLWPNYNDGSYPSNCDSSNPFKQTEIADLTSSLHKDWPTLACPSGNGIKFWSHEWEKHGTCSESVLQQHDYFEASLTLKKRSNLLQALNSAGIEANGGSYSLSSVREAIKEGIGYAPFIECNEDSSGNSQLYQVYLCVDASASNFIECPVFPRGNCSTQIQIPSF
ncbi:ribonuclease 1-like [Prosopis cineraria]|uniref:ribonuclease 1-like n=1 Tax=Prosopis cineraria TaxID=364024 RepID=UPI0024109076|nr:ribonuclease 1-like [Prosopis cineraria]XP_054825735.1 ribonuclease 1-like [Prosopis cineraria]